MDKPLYWLDQVVDNFTDSIKYLNTYTEKTHSDYSLNLQLDSHAIHYNKKIYRIRSKNTSPFVQWPKIRHLRPLELE